MGFGTSCSTLTVRAFLFVDDLLVADYVVKYTDLSSLKIPVQGAEQRRVQCTAREFKDLVVPIPTLRPRPDNPSNQRQKSKASSAEREEAQEDWDIEIQSLFEWVGMACLGAQR